MLQLVGLANLKLIKENDTAEKMIQITILLFPSQLFFHQISAI
ncbi:hypothetical protein [uncultured Aquimarina sp.]|nr:hypothetical protein [uncultured Aquimarina sp.]